MLTLWVNPYLVQSVVGYGVVVQEVKYGAGRHLIYLAPQTAKTGLLLNFVTQPIYLYAALFVKISIGLFLLRFAQDRKYRVFIKSVNSTPAWNFQCPTDACWLVS